MAGAMTNYMENKIIDFIFRGRNPNLPPEFYVGLFRAPIDESGEELEEVSESGYARAAIARDLLSWCGTQEAGSTDISNGSSGRTSNNVPIMFGYPIDGWGVITDVGIFDAPQGGNMLWYGHLTIPKAIYASDDPPSFSLNDLVFQIDT